MGKWWRIYAMSYDDSLKDRSILITGGNRGLGREMALSLAKSGVKLCITASKNGDAFKNTKEELIAILGEENVCAEVVDVSDAIGMSQLTETCIEKFSTIDVLINNAARGMRVISETFNTVPTKFWETNPEAWSNIIDANIKGPFIAARYVVPYMIKNKFGKIINISTSSQTMIRKGYSPYGPSKAFIESTSRAWASDLEGTGVDVNVLLPGGATDTDLLPPSENKKGADGNLLPPSIMNDAIQWLASDKSNGITGGRFIGRYWNDIDARVDSTGQNPQIM
jgi:NAD(P)-dependent dehydrogenase (short-subunit alcohol dehydrogenase family)